MSKSIDERVVRMEFDNENFEKNVAQTRTTLEKLKQALDFSKSKDSFIQMEEAAKNLSFASLNKNVDTLASKLSGLGAVGTGFLLSVGNRLEQFAHTIATKFIAPLNQIKSGGWQRALNLQQAEFQLGGLVKGWTTVAEKEQMVADIINNAVSPAVDGTAYGLDEAAVVASTMYASGIRDSEQLKNALLGVSGAAAMTGRSYSDIGNIFSTVASNGKLMTMQLRQFSSMGLNVSATLAEQLGTTEEAINEMVQKGKIDFETFATAMNQAFGEHAKDANNTYAGSLSNVKAALSRIGALFTSPWTTNIIPFFNAIKDALNRVKKELVGSGDIFDQLTKRIFNVLSIILQNESFLNGIGNTVQGLANIFWSLYGAIQSVVLGFAQVMFPQGTIKSFEDATRAFKEWTEKAGLTKKSLEGLIEVGRALASVIKLPVQIISKMVNGIFPELNLETYKFGNILAAVLTLIGKGTQKLTEHIAAWEGWGKVGKVIGNIFYIVGTIVLTVVYSVIFLVQKIKDFMQSETFLEAKTKVLNVAMTVLYVIFKAIGYVAIGVGTAIYTVGWAIGQLIQKIKDSQVGQTIFAGLAWAVEKVADGFHKLITGGLPAIIGIFQTIGRGIKKVWDTIAQAQPIQKFLEIIKPLIDGIKTAFTNLGEALNFSGGKLEKTGNMWKTIGGFFVTIGKGIIDTFKNVISTFKELADGMKGAEKSIDLGRAIALALTFAILVLHIAVVKLADEAAKAVGKIGGFFGSLKEVIDNKFLGKRSSTAAENMRAFALAVIALSASLSILSGLDTTKMWESVAIIGTLTAIMIGLNVALAATSKFFGKGSNKFFDASVSNLFAFAVVLGVLTAAVKKLMDAMPDDIGTMIAKTIAGVGSIVVLLATLAGIAIFLNKYGASISMGSIAIVFFALSAKKLVDALVELEQLDMAADQRNIETLLAIMVALGLLAKGVGKIKLSSLGGFALLAYIFANYCVQPLKELAGVLSGANMDRLWDFLNSELIQMTIFIVATGLTMLKFAKALKTPVTAVKESKKLLDKVKSGFSSVFSGISGVLFGMVAMIGTILIVIKAFQKMEDLDAGRVWLAVGVVITIVAAMSIMIVFLSRCAKDGRKLTSVTGTILAITLSIFIIIAQIKMLMKIFTGADFNPGAFIAASVVIAAFMVVLGFTIALAGMSRGLDTKPIVAVVVGIVALCTTLVVLTLMPLQEMVAAAVSMFAVMGGLALVLNALSKLQSETKKSGRVIATLLSLTLMLGVLGASLYFVSKHNWKQIAASAAGIAGCMIAFGYVFKSIANIDARKLNMKKIGPMLLTTIVMLGSIGLALGLLSNFGGSWDAIAASAVGISIGIFALANTLSIISTIKTIPPKESMQMLLEAVALLLPIGVALSVLSNFGGSFEGMMGAALGISTALIGLSVAFNILNTAVIPDSGQMQMFGTACALLIPITAAIGILSQFGGEALNMIAAAGALSLAMIALSFCLTILANMNDAEKAIGNAVAVLIASLAMIPLAMALSQLAGYDWADMWPGLVALAGLFAVLALVLGILSALNSNIVAAIASAAALFIASLSMLMIGNALAQLASVPWENIQQAASAMIKVFLTLSIVMAILSIIAIATGGIGLVAILGVAAALVMLGAAVLEAGIGMMTGGAGLMMFAMAMQVLQTIDLVTIGTGLVTLIPGLAALALTGVGLLIAGPGLMIIAIALNMLAPSLTIISMLNLADLGSNMISMAQGFLALGGAGLVLMASIAAYLAFGTALSSISKAVTGMATVDFVTLATGLAMIAQVGTNLAVAGVYLTAGVPGLLAMANAINIFSVIMSICAITIPLSVNAIVNAINLLTNTLIPLNGQAIGTNYANGVVLGLQGGLPNVITAVTNMAKALPETMQNLLQIHSPSEVAKAIARFFGIGVEQGIAEETPGVAAQTTTMGNEGIISPIRNAITKAWGALKAFGEKVKNFFKGLKDAAGEATGLTDAISEFTGGTFDASNIMSMFDGVAENLGFDLNSLTGITDDLTGSMDGLDTSLSNIGGAGGGTGTGSAGRAAGSVSDLSNALDGLGDSIGMDTTASLGNYNTGLDTMATTAPKAKSAVEELTDSIKSSRKVYDEFSLGDLFDPAKILTNIQSNIDGIRAWSANFTKLQKLGASKQLLKYLKSLGLEGANVVQSFANMTKAELMEANKLFKQLEKQPKKAAKNIQKQIKKATNSTKKNLKKGLTLDTNTMDDDMYRLGKNAIHALNSSLDIHSPSGEAEKTANFLMLGLLNRLKKGVNEVGTAGELLGESAISGLNDVVSGGLTSDLSDILTKYADAMTAGSTKIDNSMMPGLVSTMDKVRDFLNENLDLSPVITPRIDFTQLRSDISSIGSLFSSAIMSSGALGITPWGSTVNGAQNIQNESSAVPVDAAQMADQIVAAINEKLEPVNVQVDVDYDESGLLKVVATQNNIETKRTGYNVLARQSQA